jgi:hypothetical protein
MKWRVMRGQDGWVVEVLRGVAMVLEDRRISNEKWEVVAGPFSTEAEAERERARREGE